MKPDETTEARGPNARGLPSFRGTPRFRLDAASGALQAVSPWLFGCDDRVWIPHPVLGLVEIAAALTTQTHPRSAERPVHGAGR